MKVKAFFALFFLMSIGTLAAVAQNGGTYRDLLSKWTKRGTAYKDFNRALDISATFRTPEFIRGYVSEYASAYGLTPTEEVMLLDEESRSVSSSVSFFVQAYSTYEKGTDFGADNGLWKAWIENDEGERVGALRVRNLTAKNIEFLKRFYPDVSDYFEFSLFEFPSNLPDGRKKILNENKTGLKLVIAGALGRVELYWDLK